MYTYADGGRFEGEWIDDKVHGRGVSVYASGNRYEGEWVDGKMEGRGTYENSLTGGKFEGSFKDNRKHGHGEETWGNKLGIRFQDPMGWWHPGNGYCRYVGTYDDSYFHGNGYFQAVDNRSYTGEWKKGKVRKRRREGESEL